MAKNRPAKASKKTAKSSITRAVYKYYSLRPRELLNQKDVAQLFTTLHREKKKPIQY